MYCIKMPAKGLSTLYNLFFSKSCSSIKKFRYKPPNIYYGLCNMIHRNYQTLIYHISSVSVSL